MPKSNQQTNPEHGFDAVAESRRWKKAVAAKIATLTTGERVAWFREQSSVASIRQSADASSGGLVMREEPDKGRRRKRLRVLP